MDCCLLLETGIATLVVDEVEVNIVDQVYKDAGAFVLSFLSRVLTVKGTKGVREVLIKRDSDFGREVL